MRNKKDLYKKICRRCSDIYETGSKFGRICPKCNRQYKDSKNFWRKMKLLSNKNSIQMKGGVKDE